MVLQGPHWCQFEHHGQRFQADAHQCHHSWVLELAHDGQLLTKVLIATQHDVFVVTLAKYLHCHRLTFIRARKHLRGGTGREGREGEGEGGGGVRWEREGEGREGEGREGREG